MFLSGVVWTKSFSSLFCAPEEEETRPVWRSREGFCLFAFFFCSDFFSNFFFKVLQCSFIVQIHFFLLHRQAGMLTHKPCREIKLARADGKNEERY